MKEAIEKSKRRRTIQEAYNEKNGITPKTIIKEIREVIPIIKKRKMLTLKNAKERESLLMQKIEEEMKDAASKLDFERATELRDILFELKSS